MSDVIYSAKDELQNFKFVRDHLVFKRWAREVEVISGLIIVILMFKPVVQSYEDSWNPQPINESLLMLLFGVPAFVVLGMLAKLATLRSLWKKKFHFHSAGIEIIKGDSIYKVPKNDIHEIVFDERNNRIILVYKGSYRVSRYVDLEFGSASSAETFFRKVQTIASVGEWSELVRERKTRASSTRIKK